MSDVGEHDGPAQIGELGQMADRGALPSPKATSGADGGRGCPAATEGSLSLCPPFAGGPSVRTIALLPTSTWTTQHTHP